MSTPAPPARPARPTALPPEPATATPPRWGLSTFRALRHRNYRLYFAGQLVSLLGTWVQLAALTWLAYELTHQSTWPALVSAAQVVSAALEVFVVSAALAEPVVSGALAVRAAAAFRSTEGFRSIR